MITVSHGRLQVVVDEGTGRPSEVQELLDELSRLNNELVTTQRELERRGAELARANEEKNALLGMAAHDLRNPIGAIGGLAETLRIHAADRLDERERMILERIESSSRRMATLVNDLLVLSQSEADRGGPVIEHAVCDLASIVETSVEIARMAAEHKDIGIDVVGTDHPVELVGDAGKLEQIATNLLTNAIKYSHRGGKVSVVLEASHDAVVLRVIDRGVGIPVDEQASIFTAFTKAGPRPTEGEASSGLGLAIVQRLVHGHGGTIDVRSQPGSGSIFTVTLPRAR